MTVIIMKKDNFNCTQLENVSSITYDGTNYVVTSGGSTYTYAAVSYNLQILWK